MALRIVMLGAPGAGKGTQAVRIAKDYNLPHISTGDIFRKHLKEGTDLGKQVQEYLNSGGLVPDELTCAIVEDRLKEADCADGFILDGFPRTVPQAEALDALLDKLNQNLTVAIDVEVPDEEIIDRLSARRSDPETGAIYNLKFDPPPPDVAGRVIQREDDKPETVKERLRVYHEMTEPIIDYYRQQGILKEVSGAGSTPDKVYEEVKGILDAAG